MESSPAKKQSIRYTYADYLQWPKEERWEIIDGQAWDMSPAPAMQHQRVSWELSVQIGKFLKNKLCQGFAAPFDVRLSQAETADWESENVVQPDISVICDPDKIDDRGCRGAPDWIVEIISPATASKDHILKRELYERYGVREYWLVHPTDQIVTVFVLEANGKYGAPVFYDAESAVEVKILPGLTIDFREVFG